MKLCVNLVVWNGGKYIPFLFESLRKQTYRGWHLNILDNASEDNTVVLIENELKNFPISFNFIKNDSNLGFAGGHNLLYKKTSSEFILLLNQDIYLLPDCLQKLMDFMVNNDDVGAATPRLMKWNFSGEGTDLPSSFSLEVDSVGLKIFRDRRVTDIRDFKKDVECMEIFGVSGALPLYRMAALRNVEYQNGSMFDETYHSYKEDVDLAYRLSNAGWKSFAVLNAIAYHDRSAYAPEDLNVSTIIKNKNSQTEWVKYHSYKNHLMTLYKNEYWENFSFDFLCILWYELRKFVYYLFFGPKVISGLKEILSQRKELLEKRMWVSKSKKLSWKNLRKWWSK